MKTLGNTNDGGLLVEMSPLEAKWFRLLEESAKENNLSMVHASVSRFEPSGEDMSPHFQAIALWVRARFAVNELQQTVDECALLMGGWPKKKDG